MNNKDKKIIEEQDKLLDHLIEYAGRQYIDEEIKKYEELPELEPSKECTKCFKMLINENLVLSTFSWARKQQ